MRAPPRLEGFDFGTQPFPGEALHDTLARCREMGPVVETRFIDMPACAIVRYEPLLEAFRDGERFPPERISLSPSGSS